MKRKGEYSNGKKWKSNSIQSIVKILIFVIITALCDLHLTNLVAANIVFGPKSTIFCFVFCDTWNFAGYLFIYYKLIIHLCVMFFFCFVARIVQLELNVPVVLACNITTSTFSYVLLF